jgi:transcriptional regulator with XRE-family HTH domain
MINHSLFYADVGRRIRKAREAFGMTQEGLASLVSLTRTSVTNIEKGRQKILLHTIVDIATALRVAPADLLPEGKSEPENELDDLLKGRPRKERDWIKSTINAARKER